jgi:hypothetical protein
MRCRNKLFENMRTLQATDRYSPLDNYNQLCIIVNGFLPLCNFGIHGAADSTVTHVNGAHLFVFARYVEY